MSGNRIITSNENIGIDKPSESTADERAKPIDPMAGEITAGDGWTEGSSWVHGSTAEWAGSEDVGADDEADGDWGDGAERSFLGISGGGVDGVD